MVIVMTSLVTVELVATTMICLAIVVIAETAAMMYACNQQGDVVRGL